MSPEVQLDRAMPPVKKMFVVALSVATCVEASRKNPISGPSAASHDPRIVSLSVRDISIVCA